MNRRVVLAQLLAAAMNDAQRPHQFVGRQRHGHQRAGRDFAQHRRLGQQADAGVDFDRPA